jgi:2,3-bisphosphoglycerate-independent phosphoglycerate mutase
MMWYVVPSSSHQADIKVALLILDGFGLAPAGPGNAVALAHTPNFDRYWNEYPHTELAASGLAVGLPEGQMGNSEVGHMNLGAGRVVMQSLTYIQQQIDSGEFALNPVLREAYTLKPGQALHLLGLVSRGGVHSDMGHLFGLLELAKRLGTGPVYIHAFTDGRDTAPDSGLGYLAELQAKIDALAHDIQIASVSGRYYAMDRDQRWERVKRAFEAVVCGQSEVAAESAKAAVAAAYARGETDEFISPTVITRQGQPVATMNDGDSLFYFNFRADRVRQLSHALMDQEFGGFARCRTPKLRYASLMKVADDLPYPFAFSLPSLDNPLPDVLAAAGKTQYHTAETEKYPHVTYFFNAAREEQVKGETRVMVPSPKVATYDLKPEMSAPELTEATLKRIREVADDFILLNYANPDMVGHTGVLEAAVKACETVDEGLGKLVTALRAQGYTVLVVADHGNAEVMIDERGEPHTAHTTNPVPFIVIGDDPTLRLRSGVLGDVAPTVLKLLGLPQPPEMTGSSLIID